MSGDLLIRNAELLVPEGDPWRGDVLVREGRIAQIGQNLSPEGVAKVIDAEGHTLMPGVIDPQVHFREPGREHKEDLQTGSWACARGGVTSFLEMPNTDPLTIDQATLDDKLARAGSKCVVNYGFFIGATADNLEELQTVQGACGIKIFMGSMHGPLLVDDQAALERIFGETDPNFLIAVHAEDLSRIKARKALFAGRTDVAVHSQIQDEESALIASRRALDLATRYRHRLHILHLSTGLEVELLRQHKPAWVTAEVTPQHLLLSTADYA
ncbi:amidohydrolase family protein, partial [Synechococcus sp. R55.7]